MLINQHISFLCLQKPYACQVPDCVKRYTDPSSLRKHVKNHTIKDQLNARRKSTTSTTNQIMKPKNVGTGNKRRTQSSSESTSSAHNTPPTGNSIFEEVFNDTIEPPPITIQHHSVNHHHHQLHQQATGGDHNLFDDQTSLMNFNELSNCIVTIQNDNDNFQNTSLSSTNSSSSTNQTVYNFLQENINDDEFISYECVKKILNDPNIDYSIESAIQNQFDLECLNVV